MPARLAAALLLALVVGCAPTTPTPSVHESASATGAPSTEVPPATPGPASVLQFHNGAARVIVDRLPIRVEPSPAGDSHGDLMRGDVVVLLVFEPVEFNGVPWYLVMQVPEPGPHGLPDLPALFPDEETATGWIAARDATGETVAKLAPRCPETRDFANVSVMLSSEQLECFGADSIVVDGTFSCAGCEEPGTGEPAWLVGSSGGRLSEPSVQGGGRLVLHFPPSVQAPEEDERIRVIGHFDDPLASTCRITVGGFPTAKEVADQFCRQQFVVESFELVSVEEAPPAD